MTADMVMLAAWLGFLAGILSGIVPGLLFYKADWMGGYGSWSRRLTRLGHVALFALGFLNLGYALTMRSLGLGAEPSVAACLLVTGAITMPVLCYLSAWKQSFRHLFFIPVLSLGLGVGLTIIRIWPHIL